MKLQNDSSLLSTHPRQVFHYANLPLSEMKVRLVDQPLLFHVVQLVPLLLKQADDHHISCTPSSIKDLLQPIFRDIDSLLSRQSSSHSQITKSVTLHYLLDNCMQSFSFFFFPTYLRQYHLKSFVTASSENGVSLNPITLGPHEDDVRTDRSVLLSFYTHSYTKKSWATMELYSSCAKRIESSGSVDVI